jgi:hypothetical protein
MLSEERKQLIKDLRLAKEQFVTFGPPNWLPNEKVLQINHSFFAVHTKRLEIIMGALRDANERKLSARDSQGLLFLAHHQALVAIKPMMDKMIVDLSPVYTETALVTDLLFCHYIDRMLTIGENWR